MKKKVLKVLSVISKIVVFVGVILGITYLLENVINNKQDEIVLPQDDQYPTITILKDNLEFYDTEDIDYLNYVEVKDNQGKCEVKVLNDEEDLHIPGEKQVNIEAIDKSGNKQTASLNVTIKSQEEWVKFVNSKTYNYSYRRLANEELIEKKGPADEDVFKLALNFIGMKGSCDVVAQAFIDTYLGEGHDILVNTYRVTKEEAMPGDVIFYVDGGIGLQHYAIYLGGCSALQGNINGTTVIGSVYMNHGSTPQFFRCY